MSQRRREREKKEKKLVKASGLYWQWIIFYGKFRVIYFWPFVWISLLTVFLYSVYYPDLCFYHNGWNSVKNKDKNNILNTFHLFVFCPTIMLHFQLFLHGIIWVFFWCTTEKTKISLISVLPMNRQRKLQGIKLLCAESELPFCVVLFFFLLWTKFLTMFRLV